MTNEEKFANELIGYIFAYPDDDYMTMECLCRKLVKHGLLDKVDGYYIADRKTEQTCSKMEQVDKDINVRSKTEPTTKTETQNSNLTFEKADEPQTERSE